MTPIDGSSYETAPRFQAQADMLANRVKKRFKHFYKRFARRHIEAFRLYDWDIPEIRLVVDWYAGHLVVGEYTRTQTVPEWLPAMGTAVASALDVPPENVHLKERKAGKQEGKRYVRLDRTNQKLLVREREFSFYVNPWDYIDTGLFADHRNTRLMVREMAVEKDVLNLYCYTATFSCYAARGGARTTTSVDRSETAIAWAGENLRVNGIEGPQHRLIHAHVFDFLEKAARRQARFDLAVVDPPSYSTTRVRNMDFDIQRDHPALLQAVMKVMRDGGVIFFSTNHQGFSPNLEGLGKSLAEEITHLTIPEDYLSKRKQIHRSWKILIRH